MSCPRKEDQASSDASREEHEESAKAILAGSFLGTVKGRTIMSKETVPMFSGKGLGNQTITQERVATKEAAKPEAKLRAF
jgi:hypothetical protein